MNELCLPVQLEPSNELVRSWSVDHPKFYGVKVTHNFVDRLLHAEEVLISGGTQRLDPHICRVLAAFHGPKGAKVPLCSSTVSGCVRPIFVVKNDLLNSSALACYDGGCYLFHARAVPAKKAHEFKVRAHTTPAEEIIAAARLARHFGVPIRDNQSSDGSLSLSLPIKGGGKPQLLQNLNELESSFFDDIPYLCFSSAYIRVSDNDLKEFAKFKNFVVHLTVSGWHSVSENILRLNEFERYKSILPNVCLRVVNRQDWANKSSICVDHSAQCEAWLLNEIVQRGLVKYVIRTPFHSVHPFPGSHVGSLGSRHMASTDYSKTWEKVLETAKGECCTTGKCKTCPTICGVKSMDRRRQNPLIAGKALTAMYNFELSRQKLNTINPLGMYTARMLAKKSMEQLRTAGNLVESDLMAKEFKRWSDTCASISLSTTERRRMSNDSHAIVVDGIDRHGLWRGHTL